MPRPDRGARRARGLLVATNSRVLPARKRFWRQVNNHSVALISLVVAIISLGYNTWRNETTEMQRNWRQASFQVLIEVGELNQIVLYRRYFHAPAGSEPDATGRTLNRIQDAQSWVAGWGKAAMIRDLTSIMPEPLPARGQELFDTWQTHGGELDAGDPQARQIASETLLAAIEKMRGSMVKFVNELR
ncbi:MAG: hypothetical protein RQ847_07315 [Wenzhouxiangellaceae bacterium]|nr:hypothetical protein [Wenzhouxiangellaceae bacterium]